MNVYILIKYHKHENEPNDIHRLNAQSYIISFQSDVTKYKESRIKLLLTETNKMIKWNFRIECLPNSG